METSPRIVQKSPQELAAQVMSSYTTFNENIPSADSLNREYKSMRQRISGLLAQKTDNATLAAELDAIYREARTAGIYRLSEGENSQAALIAEQERYVGYGYSADEALQKAQIALPKQGVVGDLAESRKWEEQTWNEPFNNFVERHPLDPQEEREKIRNLFTQTISLDNLTEADLRRLHAEFPGGNFLYHGAKAPEIIKILKSGQVRNFKAIWEEESQKATEEGREAEIQKRNSGYEGISWSLNNIQALPGDRYHLAGFVGAPALVLQEDQQYVIPSRPAPYELLQINTQVDPNRYYELKTQLELYQQISILGESPSILDNIFALTRELKIRREEQESNTSINRLFDEPSLFTLLKKHSDPEITEMIKSKYSVDEKGVITIAPDLVQQHGDHLPPAAVWMQALIDTGRIEAIPEFAVATSVREIIERVNEQNYGALINEMKKDRTIIAERLARDEAKITNLAVDIQNLYLVTSRLDLPKWLKILARLDHQPRGILVYDHKKVRLENFNSDHIGDHETLTQELQKGIIPDPGNGYIDWGKEVLGEELTPEKYTGQNKHVIREAYLGKRKSLRKDTSGALVIS